MSPELQSKIQMWRRGVLDGTITEAQMAEAITALRADRVGAAVASEKSKRSKAKAEIPSADDMLKELGL